MARRKVTRPPNPLSRARRKLDRVRILIERQHVGAGAQNRLGVAAAAAGRRRRMSDPARREQLDCLGHEHRAVIGEVFHFLALLINRSGPVADQIGRSNSSAFIVAR